MRFGVTESEKRKGEQCVSYYFLSHISQNDGTGFGNMYSLAST